jgi:hypothetical protein
LTFLWEKFERENEKKNFAVNFAGKPFVECGLELNSISFVCSSLPRSYSYSYYAAITHKGLEESMK